jgi:hypothetical protein
MPDVWEANAEPRKGGLAAHAVNGLLREALLSHAAEHRTPPKALVQIAGGTYRER